MDETTGTAKDQPSEEPGVANRMLSVLFTPGEVFASLTRKTSDLDWLLPLIVTALVGLGTIQLVKPLIMQQTRAQIESQFAGQEGMSEEKLEQLLSSTETFGRYGAMASAAVMTFVSAFILAALFLALTNFIMGGQGTFRSILAVTAYSSLVGIPGAIISIPVFLARGSLHVQFGPGLMLDDGAAGTFFYGLMAIISLFDIWRAALISIGIGMASGVPTKHAAAGVFVLYAIYVLGAASIRNAISG